MWIVPREEAIRFDWISILFIHLLISELLCNAADTCSRSAFMLCVCLACQLIVRKRTICFVLPRITAIPFFCGKPTITNGKLQSPQLTKPTFIHSTVRYTCNAGYQIANGSSSDITCQAKQGRRNGEWTSSFCKSKF